MSRQDIIHQLIQTVDELSEPEALQGIFHEHRDGDPLPSAKELEEIIELSRSILFPGFYGKSSVNIETIKYQIGVNMERLHKLLSRQIMAGLCFDEDCHCPNADDMRRCMQEEADMIAGRVITKFPTIRKTLSTDIQAAFDGDPAAVNQGEVISCYPAVKAIINYRLAHELVLENVPLIPRMITEMAHSETGIDIHPAATIGTHFTIDHGTGVVIGATCIIGNHVKLYQGVTLGAKSFPLDKDEKPIKGIPRHPILKDNVIVYANATVLGRVTIGKGCVIGANVWVTRDMRPCSKKYKQNKTDILDIDFEDGSGI
ncbi:serine O-acetyltransferase [Prevotella fusca]|uniref:serine O-acetyltransferase n=1 Tax=Prevotella fusca JCM 17724 TaxID=1236517 RepID=A0A0K1NM19_9BACT|nr:serine acetyltransferase [Prevotella fusca]AKU70127.1 serine acetyltransferase [Prevotella fusca JCM 17724]QUB85740.1 serine acetyltransferase [Prevotella fusca JCM 17724]